MDRNLLEKMLKSMKNKLRNGEDIGNLKVGALFALGKQLEAIFYYVGHELGFKFDVQSVNEVNMIVENLKQICVEFHLGDFIVEEQTPDHITFTLLKCNSCKEYPTEVPTKDTVCSFEAGLFAGIVEKMSNKHCFAQEMSCKLQEGVDNCQFMIVIPQDE